MPRLFLTLCFLLISTAALAQTGTITGTVSDATGAVLPGVSIVATNTDTAANYDTVSTETGNYVLTAMPPGVYQMAVELPGFKKYVRRGITVLVAQTLRVDVGLEVGADTEEVTVTADAALLRTESSDVSTIVKAEQLSELPLLGIGQAGAGNAGIRNPWGLVQLVPGASFKTNVYRQINGLPTNTERIRIEGQDGSTNIFQFYTAWNQPSPDEIQEVNVLTSNFAAEYGSTGGGLINVTMKSGTNQYHGTGYDYFVNEFLNAGTPYLPLTAQGRNPRDRSRRQDYGWNFGGPVKIPNLYDGHNKTFFFTNAELYHERKRVNNVLFTVPIQAYRAGDFSSLLTGRQLGTDPLGRPIMEGTIYDPSTERVVNGQVVREPFQDNKIPLERQDPVALKIQSFIPPPTLAGTTNNFLTDYPGGRDTWTWSFKVDHNLNASHKLSYYHSNFSTYGEYGATTATPSFPVEISSVRASDSGGHTERLNYDWTVSPTLLLHLGLGYQTAFNYNPSRTINQKSSEGRKRNGFDALATFGLPGQTAKYFPPYFSGLLTANGGVEVLGENQYYRPQMQKPTLILTLTWVKNNHTYKFGGEGRKDIIGYWSAKNTSGEYAFAPDQTGLGRLQTLSGGFVGFPYASFLLGLVNTGSSANQSDPRVDRYVTAMFAQDSWKVTPKFTLDYGLRWDYSGYPRERYGRVEAFSPTTINPVTGTPGAAIFEGNGPGRCSCNLAKNYWFAFGPRLGAAWQALPKTVVRAGLGVAYSQAVAQPYLIISDTFQPGVSTFVSPAVGQPAFLLKNGVPAPRPWPTYNAGIFPSPNSINFTGPSVDPSGGRPPRRVEWTLAIQREITPNFALEVAYVGNRGVWWESDALRNLNANTPERLAFFGLDVTNPADFALLRSRVDSSTAIARGFGPASKYVPYQAFPTSSTVAQMLRPFPQFPNLASLWTPQGKTWYDALQVKATKRLSNGLDFSGSFAWQKELLLGTDWNQIASPILNTFNYGANKTLTPTSRPLSLTISGTYRLPVLNIGRALSAALRDWQIGAVTQYASGIPIKAPVAQTQLDTVLFGGNSYAVRVPGQPLYTVDVNCHCFDPLKTFVLNPKAWANPAIGQFGTSSPHFNDYRTQRRPSESMSLGRVFQIREGMEFSVRAEFNDVFNRRPVNDPASTNAGATQQLDPQTGKTLAGFGQISPSLDIQTTARTGTVVARLRF
jgi:hypothetical protein